MRFNKLFIVPAFAAVFTLGACAEEEPYGEGVGVAEEGVGVVEEGIGETEGVLEEGVGVAEEGIGEGVGVVEEGVGLGEEEEVGEGVGY